ncbi:hypothetical protein GR160_01440 [Flavobacterium sp. Sd200]|uniref:hypothetical protein n=1 Tax=Flavobacterium sp. Sd200 TaxID=2692211 RepID=UPI00136DF06B|nr:hypothetical protein [Flavobacterium sp. Sd200]MXN89877.1 hypothetical protein [Flavobacterium sp. Sd200]
MIRIITILIAFVCNIAAAQSQYENGMQKAFTLWGDNKPTEASALFERIAAVEKNNWLPSYYVALVNTTEAFKTKDKQTINALLVKAQTALDNAVVISADNAELLVVQAMIHTAKIVADPMNNGMKLSPVVTELYDKALKLAPNNPRVVFNKAQFEMGSAQFFGSSTKPMCEQIERSVTLFANFKPETPFHPKWGKENAEEALKECKK